MMTTKLHGRTRVAAPCRAFVVCDCPCFLIVDYLLCVNKSYLSAVASSHINQREIRPMLCWLCRPSMFVADAVDVALVDVEQTRLTCAGACRHYTAGLDASADFCDSRPIQAPRLKLSL
jgi:hypothetical protein